jgi:transposase
MPPRVDLRKVKVKCQDSRLIDYLLLLRFGTQQDELPYRPLLNYAAIARTTKLPYRTVIDLIKVGVQARKEQLSISKRIRSKLSEDHIAYLISPETLSEWAHASLKERVKRFHRHFGEVRISVSTLRRLYLRHKIKFKFIKRVKKEIDFKEKKYNELFIRMRTLVELSKVFKQKVIFLDETVFTFSTFRSKAWSMHHNRIKVVDSDLRIQTQAMISAISSENGLEGYYIHPRSIKTEQFVDFIKDLSMKQGGQPFSLFLDNLTVHKAKESKALFEQLNITEIYNVPYCPQFNGIESYFSLVKAQYKKLLLHAVIKGSDIDTVALIETAVKNVDETLTKRCVEYGCV